MRLFYLGIFVILCFFLQNTVEVFSNTVFPDCNIINTLRVGSRGTEVRCLQGKIGVVQDGNFGRLTKVAVMNFQLGHGLMADGIVGPRSRTAFNDMDRVSVLCPNGNTVVSNCMIALGASTGGVTPLVINNGTNTVIPPAQPPKVLSVSPEKVRSGDIVKIYGENFASTGNTVRLRYGQIEDRFENLPSSDGRVISFVFQPPEVATMSKDELLDLPSAILNKILDPVKASGGSIDDIVAPYRNMQNEYDLRKLLSDNGHNFDELYDKFYVTIENIHGKGSSSRPILSGLRKLSYGSNSLVVKNKNFLSKVKSLFTFFTPQKAYAQTPLGGTNSGIIMYCTCSSGYITFMTDFSTNGGAGIYWWAPGFVPTVGTPMIAGAQLGFFTKNAATCSIGVSPYCAQLTANIVNLPWGEAL